MPSPLYRRNTAPIVQGKALLTSDGGDDFVTWFDSTMVDEADSWTHVSAVPLSRTYEVADEARRRAAFWSSFAETVERQVRRRA